jgi:hypothetical protein
MSDYLLCLAHPAKRQHANSNKESGVALHPSIQRHRRPASVLPCIVNPLPVSIVHLIMRSGTPAPAILYAPSSAVSPSTTKSGFSKAFATVFATCLWLASCGP